MRYLFADCLLDTQCYLLRRAGQSIRLRPKVFHALTYLLAHRDRVIPKQELCEQIWSVQAVSNATIENCLKAIRQAIGDNGRVQRLIETRYGQGYRFIAAVTVSPDGAGREASEASALVPAHTALSCAVPASSLAVPAPSHASISLSMDDAHSTSEWKVVTVLCCACVCPAGQGEPHNLEVWQQRWQTLYELAYAEAQRYGGMCRPLRGDSVLLVFGAPVAQEDHAQRAVLAALSMQQQLRQWQDRREASGLEALEVRLSLHTGRAVVEARSASHTMDVVLGESVTQAIALQEACAASGTILCSETTARFVHQVARLKVLPTVTGERPTTPGPLYQLLGRRMRYRTAVPPGGRTYPPMVGRARELAMLHAVWAHVVQGHGRVVSIVGEAGMGKSRLVTAWRVSLRRQLHLYVQGSCLSYEQEKPYQPIVALLRHACGITAAHTPTMIAAKVHRLLSKIGLDPVVAAPHLLPLLGGDTASHCLAPRSPEARQACTLATLVQLCQQSSARSPLVIVVEDLHWIDAASEAWLAGLVEQLANRRILLLVTCRPGYHPPWLGCSYATQVRLSRLTLQDSAQLVHALCPLQRLPSALQHEIATCADGNPFYLTELTRSVVTDGGTQLPPVLPDTISTVLSARLDRLTPVTKRVVQTAAVIGTETSLALLEAVTQCSKEALSQSLAQLQTAALLAKTGLASEPVYTFTHGLIRETAYQALLESTRRRQHLHIAQVVTAQFATMAVMQPAWLAQQYTQAGCVEQAISYWQEAGQLAADHAAHAEAIVYFTQALTLVRTLPVTPAWVRQAFTLQCRLGGQLATRGAATPEVERTYAQALELYQQVGNAQELCSVLYGLSRMYKKRGKLRCARDLGAQMLMLAQHQGNTALLLRGHYVLGEALLWLGEFVSARAHLEHGLAAYDPQQHARQDGLAAAEPWLGCLGALAITLWFLGYPDQAMQRSAEAMHVAQALAHPYSLACALVDAAYLHWFCGDWEKLWERTETLRTLAAAHGFAELYARAMYRAGLALVKQGEIDAGLRQFHESLHALQVMGSEDAQALRFAQLAELCGDAGQPEAGLEALATAMSAETDERFDAAGRCRLQGELLLQLPCPDMRQAEVCFQQALTIAREQRAKMQELRAALCLSHLWYAQGKRTEAYQLLTPVYGWFTEGFMVPDLQAASAWLEQLA